MGGVFLCPLPNEVVFDWVFACFNSLIFRPFEILIVIGLKLALLKSFKNLNKSLLTSYFFKIKVKKYP